MSSQDASHVYTYIHKKASKREKEKSQVASRVKVKNDNGEKDQKDAV